MHISDSNERHKRRRRSYLLRLVVGVEHARLERLSDAVVALPVGSRRFEMKLIDLQHNMEAMKLAHT